MMRKTFYANRTEAINVHKEMITRSVFPSCLNCDSFGEKTGICGKYNAKPPAEIIVFSCGTGWTDDIPF